MSDQELPQDIINIIEEARNSPTIKRQRSYADISNDIVSRIREDCFTGQIPEHKVETCLEAADEIEKLRYKLSKLRQSLQDVVNQSYRD